MNKDLKRREYDCYHCPLGMLKMCCVNDTIPYLDPSEQWGEQIRLPHCYEELPLIIGPIWTIPAESHPGRIYE